MFLVNLGVRWLGGETKRFWKAGSSSRRYSTCSLIATYDSLAGWEISSIFSLLPARSNLEMDNRRCSPCEMQGNIRVRVEIIYLLQHIRGSLVYLHITRALLAIVKRICAYLKCPNCWLYYHYCLGERILDSSNTCFS